MNPIHTHLDFRALKLGTSMGARGVVKANSYEKPIWLLGFDIYSTLI